METLSLVLDRAQVVEDPAVIAVGRRVTLRDADGETMTFTVVLPGDGAPADGSISADSPLGRALHGARVGDTIEVPAPAGSWSAAVVALR